MRDTVRSAATLDRLITSSPTGKPRRRLRFGLAGRVLVLFAVLVMVADVAVLGTSLASYHDNWLRARLSAGGTAALVFDSIPADSLAPEFTHSLLESVGARIIVLNAHGARRILAVSDLPPAVDETYNLEHTSVLAMLAATFRTFVAGDGRVITVLGDAPAAGGTVELTLDEAPLRHALIAAALRILLWSLVTSLVAAALACYAIHRTMLRPVRRLAMSLVAFADDPEHSSHIVGSGHTHEIGEAEAALAFTQATLARELKEKKNLAALGLAVAKVNHDLRNMLASAQLLSDRLADVPDPLAQRLAPKIVRTLDRAIAFCQATLTYGRAADPAPHPRPTLLRPLVDDAVEMAVAPATITIEIAVPNDLAVVADAEHMARILTNLIRNAAEALERAGPAAGHAPIITIEAQRDATGVTIDLSDTGPGLPASVRRTLFTPFQASGRIGGSGLGLAIAADLVQAQSGSIELLERAVGTTFRLTLPAAAAAPRLATAARSG